MMEIQNTVDPPPHIWDLKITGGIGGRRSTDGWYVLGGGTTVH